MPSEKPLLLFPRPASADRDKGHGRPASLHIPPHTQQGHRLSPQFRQLHQIFNDRRAELQRSTTGIIPEQVLVLEIIGGIDNFIVAVKHIQGMEWLGELDENDLPPDDNFFRDEEHRDGLLSGRLYLVMVNQQAIQQLLSLWNHFKRDEQFVFHRGQTKWRDLFKHLKNIRPWGVEDRLAETGAIEDWKDNIARGQSTVRFEAELWFRDNPQDRTRCQTYYSSIIQREGGRLVTSAVIPEIAYHAILAEVPIASVQNIIDSNYTELICCDNIMFIRPTGQLGAVRPNYDALVEIEGREGSPPEGDPVVALLDGLPLENHHLLRGRLIIDDCDGWASDYPAGERCHGTAMASLIVHGELDSNEEPLHRPVYIRPIIKPLPNDPSFPRREEIPYDILSVDLLHTAIRRIFESDENQRAVAPSVKIINISIADPSRHFDNSMSPLARLLDWLSVKYNILFIVSAGNHAQDIELHTIALGAIETSTPEEIENATLKAIASDLRHRRILSPAESVNALTVGAIHQDSSSIPANDKRINPYQNTCLPSPFCSVGSGYRRSIKPDIFTAGGRQCFIELLGNINRHAKMSIIDSGISPGQKTAHPGRQGELTKTKYTRGTSNAAALTSRLGSKLYDILLELRQEANGDLIEEKFIAVLIKSLLVHSSSWGDAYGVIETILKTEEQDLKEFKDQVSRLLGYGNMISTKVFSCTNQRATILGCGVLSDGNAHIYEIPLPPSLRSSTITRKLTVTLAWLSPLAFKTRKYRKAGLWFVIPEKELDISQRKEVNWQSTRRGTVQHEIFEGSRASVFSEGDSITIKINCKEDSPKLIEEVPYGLAVTLEVAEGLEVPIYNEIRARIRPTLRVRAASSDTD
jgi:hypothetical protein